MNTEAFNGKNDIPLSLQELVSLQGEIKMDNLRLNELVDNTEESNERLTLLLNIQVFFFIAM